MFDGYAAEELGVEAEAVKSLLKLAAHTRAESIDEMRHAEVETEAVGRLRDGIEHMRSVSDVTSANILESILTDEEVISTTWKPSSG